MTRKHVNPKELLQVYEIPTVYVFRRDGLLESNYFPGSEICLSHSNTVHVTVQGIFRSSLPGALNTRPLTSPKMLDSPNPLYSALHGHVMAN